MPEKFDEILLSAIEKFKKGEETPKDRKIIGQAFASQQIEITPAEDSKIIEQEGGANFGESNEIHVAGSVIGTQIIRGITYEQALEIEKLKEKSRDNKTKIIVALIGAGGVIIAAIITGLFNNGSFSLSTTTYTPTVTNIRTLIPPTATDVPPTPTDILPTATVLPPTATDIPPTATDVPPTPTDTLTPTKTQVVLFQDTFIDNKNGWDLTQIDDDEKSYIRNIIAGEFRHNVECKREEVCKSNLLIQSDNLFDNFDLSFEVEYTRISTNSYPHICVFIRKTREEDKDNLYHICFSSARNYKFIRTLEGVTAPIFEDIEWKPSNDLLDGLNNKNSIRITAVNYKYTFIANGVEIDNFEDGFLLGTGQIEIVIFNVRNLKLYIDNLVILDPE